MNTNQDLDDLQNFVLILRLWASEAHPLMLIGVLRFCASPFDRKLKQPSGALNIILHQRLSMQGISSHIFVPEKFLL